MAREVPIPHFYIDLSGKNGKLFRKYVEGYIQSSYPGWELEKIKGMTAIIERKPIPGGVRNE